LIHKINPCAFFQRGPHVVSSSPVLSFLVLVLVLFLVLVRFLRLCHRHFLRYTTCVLSDVLSCLVVCLLYCVLFYNLSSLLSCVLSCLLLSRFVLVLVLSSLVLSSKWHLNGYLSLLYCYCRAYFRQRLSTRLFFSCRFRKLVAG
jgi:hypothetical protein